MAQGFYELLGVDPMAAIDDIRPAYQRRLAELVRRLRAARKQGADVTILEGQERELREAMQVLSEPSRRRRYDSYRQACLDGIPEDADQLWERTRNALVDPVASAALAAVKALTDLPLGDPLPQPVLVLEQRRPPVRTAPSRGTEPTMPPPPVARPPSVQAPPPPPEPLLAFPAQPAASDGPPRVPAIEVRPAPPRPEPAPPVPPPAVASVIDFPLPSPVYDLDAAPESGCDAGDIDPFTDYPDFGSSELPMPVQAQVELEEVDDYEELEEVELEPEGDEIDALARQFGFDGRFLRAVRDLRGIDLDDLSRTTRISLRYLTAMEENGYDRLPAATFVRGYLKELVVMLDVADRGAVEGYMALFALHRG